MDEVIRSGNSKVYVRGIGVDILEEERSFRDSYYRVIELANKYITTGFILYKFSGSQLILQRQGNMLMIGHSNGPVKSKHRFIPILPDEV